MSQSRESEFNPAFLRRLERLAIVARKTLRGAGRGERHSRRRGGTVEFADYRGYTPGDDTRRIDWYAYARLEQLFLKLYMEEQDLTVHVLLDQSASMGAGEPPKLPYARRLAVALTYVALSGGDRVTLRIFRGGSAGRPFGPLRGRRGLVRLLRFLDEDEEARGHTSLDATTRAFVASRPTPGVVILLSDALDPGGYEQPLQRLRYSGYEPHLIHLVAPDEEEPQVGQDLDLVDAESGEVATVALDRPAVNRYRIAFAGFCQDLLSFCSRHEIGYTRARTDIPYEELVMNALRQRSLVR